MKKSSILALAFIYIVAIVLVGFFGFKMKAYDTVIYAESITWNSTEFENKEGFKVIKDKDTIAKKGSTADAILEYTTWDLGTGLTINIKCHCLPLETTNSKLEYSYDSQIKNVKMELLNVTPVKVKK